MLPPLIIYSVIGLKFLAGSLISKKQLLSRFILIGIISLILFDYVKFMHRYFVIWPNESWQFWQYGFKEVMTYTKSIDSGYEKVLFNNTYEPSLGRFLFWYGYDMENFHQEFKGDIHNKDIYNGFNGFKIGEKYYFGELEKPVEKLASPKTIVIGSAVKDITNLDIFNNSGLVLLKEVKSPTGIPIFYVFTSREI